MLQSAASCQPGRCKAAQASGRHTILGPSHKHIIVSVQEEALVGGLPLGGPQREVVKGPPLAIVAQPLLLVHRHAHEPAPPGAGSGCVPVFQGRCLGAELPGCVHLRRVTGRVKVNMRRARLQGLNKCFVEAGLAEVNAAPPAGLASSQNMHAAAARQWPAAAKLLAQERQHRV